MVPVCPFPMSERHSPGWLPGGAKRSATAAPPPPKCPEGQREAAGCCSVACCTALRLHRLDFTRARLSNSGRVQIESSPVAHHDCAEAATAVGDG